MAAPPDKIVVGVSQPCYEEADVPKNDKPGRGRPVNPAGVNKPIGMRPKPRIKAALDQYIEAQEVEVTAAAVLAAALEEFLVKRGYLKESGT